MKVIKLTNELDRKMNGWDILIIAVIAALIGLAIFLKIRKKKKGSSCCGDCCNCGKSCEGNHIPEEF